MAFYAVADTSFLLAVLSYRDKNHAKALEYYEASRLGVVLPSVALTELAYHMGDLGGGRAVAGALAFIRDGPLTLIDLEQVDYDRVAAILTQYHDSRIDFVDACIMALAERLNITRILTYDRRDFGLFRPAHVEHFTLLP